MGSTNKTAHYELPQFVANDKPSWLGDVNEAMEAIDTGIYGAKSSADGAQQTANNAVAGVQSAGTRMDGIQTQLDTVATQANQTATTVAGHTSSIATNSANINTLNSRMGSTDISGIGDGTVTGAISAISGGASALNELTVSTIELTATGYDQDTFPQLINAKEVYLEGSFIGQIHLVNLKGSTAEVGWFYGSQDPSYNCSGSVVVNFTTGQVTLRCGTFPSASGAKIDITKIYYR